MHYSVLMSVYYKENPDFFRMAIDSMLKQTIPPSDFVIVCDGNLSPELNGIIERFVVLHPALFNIVRLPVNKGLGNALKIGLEACKYEIVARMDTDDLAVPDRIQKQMTVFEHHPEFSVVGGQIAEFIDTPETIVHYRIVPTEYKTIYAMAKKRNPINHMTVLLKKTAVMESGNYCDFPFFEDYHLWARMLCNGKMICNIGEVCVQARVNSMFDRRRGLSYFKYSKRMMNYMLSLKMITYPRYIKNIFVRFFATVIIPKRMLGFLMPLFTRRKSLDYNKTNTLGL